MTELLAAILAGATITLIAHWLAAKRAREERKSTHRITLLGEYMKAVSVVRQRAESGEKASISEFAEMDSAAMVLTVYLYVEDVDVAQMVTTAAYEWSRSAGNADYVRAMEAENEFHRNMEFFLSNMKRNFGIRYEGIMRYPR